MLRLNQYRLDAMILFDRCENDIVIAYNVAILASPSFLLEIIDAH
tara:strand:+ start:794 stop:928 length:135 start_codon:yes stop_codon:yes gene_type:complete